MARLKSTTIEGNLDITGDMTTSSGKSLIIEEGTWTPSVFIMGNANTNNQNLTYSLTLDTTETCTYYRIGKLLVLKYKFTFKGTYADADMYITGLPKSVEFGHYPIGDYFHLTLDNLTTGYVTVDSSNRMLFRRNPSFKNTSVNNLRGNDVSSSTIFAGHVFLLTK